MARRDFALELDDVIDDDYVVDGVVWSLDAGALCALLRYGCHCLLTILLFIYNIFSFLYYLRHACLFSAYERLSCIASLDIALARRIVQLDVAASSGTSIALARWLARALVRRSSTHCVLAI